MKRSEKLDELVKNKCDSVMVISSADRPEMNLQYYSGVDAQLASGTVFWKVGKSPTVVTRDTAQKRKVKAVPKKDHETLYRELKKIRPKVIGVNMDYVSANALKRLRKKTGAKFTDISTELKQVRAIKEKGELKSIAKACGETRKAMKRLDIAGNTETGVYSQLVSYYAEKGLPLSFDPIVASGRNTRLIHSFPTNKKIKKSDSVIIDNGCRVDGYCSDITMTHCEKPDERTLGMLMAVFGASKTVMREVRPGMTGGEISEIARDYFGKYARYWVYGLGHGVGLDVHEYPSLALGSEDVLEKGMVFTLEPGLVGPGQGARIEHTGVMTSKGFKVL